MENTYKVDRYILNSDGEILNTIRENDIVIVKKAKEIESEKAFQYRKKREEQDEFNKIREEYFGSYYTHFFNNISKTKLSNQMKTRFLYLCSFMDYEGFLVEDKVNYRKKLSKEDIFKLLNLRKSEYYKTIKELIENGLLIECDNTYKIYEKFAVRGEIENSKKKAGEYIRVFDKSIRELYIQAEPIQHKRLYYLFWLLPYINMKYNVVASSDKTEENYDEIYPMNMTDICELVGYDKTKSKRLWTELRKLKINDKDVIAKVERGDAEFIKINPSVYYGGTSNQVDDLKFLMADFGYRIQ